MIGSEPWTMVWPRVDRISSRTTDLVSPPSLVLRHLSWEMEFLHPDKIHRLMEEDLPSQSEVMADNNGWVMNDDPPRCFADEGQFVYSRPDLLHWSDSIKWRFGSCRDNSLLSCPVLSDEMR